MDDLDRIQSMTEFYLPGISVRGVTNSNPQLTTRNPEKKYHKFSLYRIFTGISEIFILF